MAHGLPGWTRLTGDARLSDGPCWFYGVIINASAATNAVGIYDGLDAGSGRYFGALTGRGTGSTDILFPAPIPFGRGLFVDIGVNITECTVIWRPMTDEEAKATR